MIPPMLSNTAPAIPGGLSTDSLVEKIGNTLLDTATALPFGQHLSLAGIAVMPADKESSAATPQPSDSHDSLPDQAWLDALLPVPVEVAPVALPLIPLEVALPEQTLASAQPTTGPAVLPTASMKAVITMADALPQANNLMPPLLTTGNAIAARQPLTQTTEQIDSKISGIASLSASSSTLPTSALMYNTVANGVVPSAATQANSTHSSTLQLQGSDDQWSQQLRSALGERLQVQADNKVQHATIRLDPPNMGKIDISLHFEAGKLQVNINAGQQDVYRALQQVSQELRQNLMQPNVQVDVQVSSQPSFNASQQQQQQHQQEKHGSPLSAEIIQAQSIQDEQSSRFNDDSILMTV